MTLKTLFLNFQSVIFRHLIRINRGASLLLRSLWRLISIFENENQPLSSFEIFQAQGWVLARRLPAQWKAWVSLSGHSCPRMEASSLKKWLVSKTGHLLWSLQINDYVLKHSFVGEDFGGPHIFYVNHFLGLEKCASNTDATWKQIVILHSSSRALLRVSVSSLGLRDILSPYRGSKSIYMFSCLD